MALLLFIMAHIFNVKGMKILNCDYSQLIDNDTLILDVESEETHKCPVCGRTCPGYDRGNQKPRIWRAPDWMGIHILLRYTGSRRVKCRVHGVRFEGVPWAYRNSHFTKDFEDLILEAALITSRTSVTRLFSIDWDTVDACIVRLLERMQDVTDKSRFDGLRHIAVDETSYQKRHKYITCVLNRDTNAIVWVGVGHDFETIAEFFKELSPEQLASIETVSGDGAKWIDKAVQQFVPHARRCVDPFHVVQWASKALDQVRVRAAKEIKEILGLEASKKVKGAMYALAKDLESMNGKQKERVEFIRQNCPELYRAYELKEALRKVLSMKDDPVAGWQMLDDWCAQVEQCGIPEFKALGAKIQRHRQNIRNSLEFRGNSAQLESMNNKIKLIIRRAYGFRNTTNLKNHVIFCCSGVSIDSRILNRSRRAS